MFQLLTLDQSTLFYWTLSDTPHKKQKHASAIKEWAQAVPATAKPTSKAAKSTSSCSTSDIPSLMGGTSHSSALSVLTDNVKIISYQALDSVKVKAESATLSLQYDGSLSNNDEMRGEEHEAVINSPPKRKKQVTSEVSFLLLISAISVVGLEELELAGAEPTVSPGNGLTD
jgi:hypothetical protein